MAFKNPHGRVNYEPNSFNLGPRETPNGFSSFSGDEKGPRGRVRSDRFADHYSQATQFYISQTPIEQQHIGDALVFELSKVQTPEIRARLVSHLLNIDKKLAKNVSSGLGLQKMPNPAKAARAPITDLAPSPALSILKNGPKTFAGRCLGVLVSEGAEAEEVNSLISAVEQEQATYKVISSHIEGVKLSDGTILKVDEKIDGGPSPLFDAIAVFSAKKSIRSLMDAPAVRDFINDALTNHKYIAINSPARALLEEVGAAEDSEQILEVGDNDSATTFIEACRKLRIWDVPSKFTREGK